MTVTVAVLGLARANAYWRQTFTVLTLGLTLMAVAGGAYVYLLARHIYLFDSSLGLGWPAGLVLLGVAALNCPTGAPETSPEPPGSSAPVSLWLPYIPLAIAGGLELVEFREKSGIRSRTRCGALADHRGAGPPIPGGRRKPAAAAQRVRTVRCATH